MTTRTQLPDALRAGPLVSAVAGGALAARGFSLPVTAVFGIGIEALYAGMLYSQPQWFDRPSAYKPKDFAIDVGSVLVGWGVVALLTGVPVLPNHRK